MRKEKTLKQRAKKQLRLLQIELSKEKQSMERKMEIKAITESIASDLDKEYYTGFVKGAVNEFYKKPDSIQIKRQINRVIKYLLEVVDRLD